MEIWTLVWFLVFPPEPGSSEVRWEELKTPDLTSDVCFERLVDKDLEFKLKLETGEMIFFAPKKNSNQIKRASCQAYQIIQVPCQAYSIPQPLQRR